MCIRDRGSNLQNPWTRHCRRARPRGTMVALGVSMRVMEGVRSRSAAVTRRLSRRPAATPAREVLGGRYELTAPLGRGGMAEVFAAYDRELERAVAIKRPRRDMHDDSAISDRLRREAIALAT